MKVEEEDADPHHDRHLHHDDEEPHRHLRDDEIVRTYGCDPEPAEDPPLLERHKSECNAEYPRLHNGHREDSGEEEIDVGEVPRFERERCDNRPPDPGCSGKRGFVKDTLEDEAAELRHLRLRFDIAVGRQACRGGARIHGWNDENKIPLPPGKPRHFLVARAH